MFAFYNGILSYYISSVPESALTVYFNGYMMIMIVMYLVLIIRLKDILSFSILVVVSFISVVQWGDHDIISLMGHGGFSFLTIVVLMILFSILKWNGVLRDISLAVEIEKARETEILNKTLEAANKEKETLLQEIHHRVKNNLQLVSSMLNLQKNFVEDEKTKAILQDSQQRVTSMSRIHETLYQSKNFSSINIADYVKKLAEEIIDLYPTPKKELITLQFDLEHVHFGINDAIPIGLIVNEILTNSVKHAFPNNQSGTIHIQLKKFEKEMILEIGDDGIGFNKDIETSKESLGKELISTLSDQIDAQLTIQSENGVQYRIKVPLKN